MIKRIQGFVTGRVQGVGFRYFAQEHASCLGVCGWVRNCDHGGVELEAQAEEMFLETFLERVHRGPPMSHVDDLRISVIPIKEDKTGFYITG